jgi:hypothetical protein
MTMNISAANDGGEEPQKDAQQKPPTPTRHFEQRRVQGDRPTGQALFDARGIASSNLFIDNETGLFVVHGPRGRIHIFLQDGARHTSFRSTQANTQLRVNTRRWRFATPEGFRQFQEIMQRSSTKSQENAMEILATEDVASVTLFTIKAFESELQAYESCIAYVLEHLSHKDIEDVTGHMRDELKEVHQELLTAILTHCPKQFLPERYKV